MIMTVLDELHIEVTPFVKPSKILRDYDELEAVAAVVCPSIQYVQPVKLFKNVWAKLNTPEEQKAVKMGLILNAKKVVLYKYSEAVKKFQEKANVDNGSKREV
jgi:hypothetical protein